MMQGWLARSVTACVSVGFMHMNTHGRYGWPAKSACMHAHSMIQYTPFWPHGLCAWMWPDYLDTPGSAVMWPPDALAEHAPCTYWRIFRSLGSGSPSWYFVSHHGANYSRPSTANFRHVLGIMGRRRSNLLSGETQRNEVHRIMIPCCSETTMGMGRLATHPPCWVLPQPPQLCACTEVRNQWLHPQVLQERVLRDWQDVRLPWVWGRQALALIWDWKKIREDSWFIEYDKDLPRMNQARCRYAVMSPVVLVAALVMLCRGTVHALLRLCSCIWVKRLRGAVLRFSAILHFYMKGMSMNLAHVHFIMLTLRTCTDCCRLTCLSLVGDYKAFASWVRMYIYVRKHMHVHTYTNIARVYRMWAANVKSQSNSYFFIESGAQLSVMMSLHAGGRCDCRGGWGTGHAWWANVSRPLCLFLHICMYRRMVYITCSTYCMMNAQCGSEGWMPLSIACLWMCSCISPLSYMHFRNQDYRQWAEWPPFIVSEQNDHLLSSVSRMTTFYRQWAEWPGHLSHKYLEVWIWIAFAAHYSKCRDDNSKAMLCVWW